MSWPQIPFEIVQESNDSLQQVCDFGNRNPEIVELIQQLFKIYSCNYDPYDSNHTVNRAINKYYNTSVADLCKSDPNLCKLIKLTARDLCKLSKLSLKDFQKQLCAFKLKTTCTEGNQNCNVAGNITAIRTKFCNECSSANRDYKSMFNTYFDFKYDKDYDDWFDLGCQYCPK